ncbi:Uncharacterised protein [Vibrio cholerae]|nr:Uncharacterised protein [Vibrio cholerae]CSD11301.1 Uncharacterised protein [Vibrio cholerae]
MFVHVRHQLFFHNHFEILRILMHFGLFVFQTIKRLLSHRFHHLIRVAGINGGRCRKPRR